MFVLLVIKYSVNLMFKVSYFIKNRYSLFEEKKIECTELKCNLSKRLIVICCKDPDGWKRDMKVITCRSKAAYNDALPPSPEKYRWCITWQSVQDNLGVEEASKNSQ